jgi:transcriptional regulator with XRE-family HTH domain
MERTKLIAARERLHWTQQQAAMKLGVGVNSLIRWERGHVRPFGYNIQRLCEVYQATPSQLGLEDEAWADETPVFAAPGKGTTLQQCAGQDMLLRFLALIWNWPRRNTHYRGLQIHILQITEGIEAMENNTTQGSISRRDALQQLAMLPFALLGLGEVVSNLDHPAEEVLPVCAAAIAACWELSRSSEAQDVQLAFEGITSYLPALKAIVQHDSSHRKAAAGLLGQSYELKTILGWHKESLSKAVEYAQKAILYSKEADDLPLQTEVYKQLSWLYSYMRQDKLALESIERAMALLQSSKSPLPANLRGSVYSSFAVQLATQRQSQQAITNLRLAHEHYFSPNAPGGELIYVDSSPAEFILEDGIMHMQLGLQKQALDSFGQIIDAGKLASKMPIPARSRIEALNNWALALLKSQQKDMEQTIKVWTAAIKEAKTLQSEQRFNEALRVYDLMETIWFDDKRVVALREHTQRW